MKKTLFAGVLALLLLAGGAFAQNVYRMRSGGQADDRGGDGVVTPATRAGTVVLKNGAAFPGDLADGTFSTDLAALKAINADPAGSSDPQVMDIVEWEEVRGPFKLGRPAILPNVPVPGGYGIVAAKSLSFVGVKKDGRKPVIYGGSYHVLTPASDAVRKSFSFRDIHWKDWWQRHICLSGNTHDFTLKDCEFTLTTARGRSFVGPLDLKGGGVVACWCPWIAPNIFDAKALPTT